MQAAQDCDNYFSTLHISSRMILSIVAGVVEKVGELGIINQWSVLVKEEKGKQQYLKWDKNWGQTIQFLFIK